MTKFSITFSDAEPEYPFDDPAIPALYGEIVLGASAPEGFLSTISSWSKAEYEAHWKRQLRALLHGRERASLIVDFSFRPEEVWNAYRDGSLVHFQNQLLTFSDLPRNLNVEELSMHLGDRTTFSECGSKISEWDVDLSAIISFLNI